MLGERLAAAVQQSRQWLRRQVARMHPHEGVERRVDGVAALGGVGIGIDVVERPQVQDARGVDRRSEEHTSELQSLMRTSYAVFCLKKKNSRGTNTDRHS